MRSLETSSIRHCKWDESQIVFGIAAGRAEAREVLVSTCHDAVYAFACKLSPDPDLRRDWTHDCILRIISDLETGAFQYKHPGGFWSWFRKRAWFLMLEARRTYFRRRAREVPEGDSGIDPAGGETPVEVLERAEIIGAVHFCIDEIEHEGQRRALRLLLLRDESYEKVATDLETPLNTVRAWIRRGRLALRRCLKRRLDLVSSRGGS